MNSWKYKIVDRNFGRVLLSDSGFETESDAEEQAAIEIRIRNIKNCAIRTSQEWEDFD